MKVNLHFKYTAAILLLIIFVMGILITMTYIHAKDVMETAVKRSSASVNKILLERLKKRAGLFAHFLADNLANPLYQYDMETIYDITRAAREQEDVAHVYVYDSKSKIVHNGTDEFINLDKAMEDELGKRAQETNRPIYQISGDIFEVAAPVSISGEVLGGVRIGFNLKDVKSDIGYIGDELKGIGQMEMDEILRDTLVITGALLAFGLVMAVFTAGGLSRPIIFLSRLADRIGQGEYDVDIPIRRRDEIGALADSFRKMTEDLKIKTTSIDNLYREIAERKKAEMELKEMDEKLAQFEKLALLGRIATGVAHEINNPLFVISGEAKMLSKDKDKETKDASKAILEQTERIEHITAKLLHFSRKKKTAPCHINDLLQKSLSLLSYQIKIENIKISKELGPGLTEVKCDADQIQEVFLNIMSNAAEAMPKDGELKIRTYRGEAKKVISKKIEKVAVIEFSDTGMGMDKETLKRLFEPFFTTKDKNTGLGLAICRGIVESHGGSIEVSSDLGKGSTFRVKLPIEGGGGRIR